jgi:hypothetical protein
VKHRKSASRQQSKTINFQVTRNYNYHFTFYGTEEYVQYIQYTQYVQVLTEKLPWKDFRDVVLSGSS